MKLGKSYLIPLVFTFVVVALASFNYIKLSLPAQEAADEGVSVISYYKFGLLPNSIVYDIWDVAPSSSQASVLGGFLRFSENLKDRTFSKVILSFRGTPKFVLDGEDFKIIGQEFEYQNPIYTIRTLPEKLQTPQGKQAFESWSGGVLGVLNAQMEDVNEMGYQWYLEDLLK